MRESTTTVVPEALRGDTRGVTRDTSTSGPFESAVPAGEDPGRYAHLLRRIRDASLSGDRPPAAPRDLVGDSWRRAVGFGVDPDHGREPAAALGPDEVEHRRHRGKLARTLPVLGDVLLPAAEDAGHVMVVVDAEGVVLWRDGPRKIQRHAERLGFAVGATWSERQVGTNAIGTALAVGRPVQIYSAEHFVKSHHSWTCAAAPILDPVDGGLLGVVDVSGAAATVHPSTLALVDAAARMAESFLREEHHGMLDALRATASPLLAGTRDPVLVTDPHGWVAAAVGVPPVARIALPADRGSDHVWLPEYGACRLEPVPGGWLVRVLDGAAAEPAQTRVALALDDPRQPRITVVSPSGRWSHRLSPRHAELALLLALAPNGRSGAQLSADLFGSPDHVLAVRAEVSRLRRRLGGLLLHRPYRFADWVDVEVACPASPDLLLPASTAPAVRRLRTAPSPPSRTGVA
ncbi:GAF domain-containing protein [Umezawaea endophytica]|uniref:GAF domain-containing protein n=1 Tax=Umezawaea endophytica TaxID=1654476 RepID=A0A9X3AHK0_9PSEU|nr:GAF domain-containing protein [Umezawaea endophytica]MCS7479505.1 GAF domain-containing protein [Umezawaea endophytica]